MGNVEKFLNPNFIGRREWDALIVDEDGERHIARSYGFQASLDTTEDTLTEVEGDMEEMVASIAASITGRLSGGFREIRSPELQAYFFGDGRSPQEVKGYTRLVRESRSGHGLLNFDKDGNAIEYKIAPSSDFVSDHNSTVLPPVLNPAALTSGPTAGGNLANTTQYFVRVVHITLNDDPKAGRVLDLTQTVAEILTDFATYKRGVDWIAHTVSASAQDTTESADSQFAVTWDDDVTHVSAAPYAVARPTHSLVLIGTSDTISAMKIAAVVAFGTEAATLEEPPSALSQLFGADVADTDLRHAELEGVSSGTRTFTDLAEGDDFIFDDDEVSFRWNPESANAKHGAPVRLNTWRLATGSFAQEYGGSNVGERYVWLRLRNTWRNAEEHDCVSVVDFPKVRISGLSGDLLTSNPDGWHGVLNRNMTFLKDRALGYSARFYGEDEAFEELIVTYGADVQPAALAS